MACGARLGLKPIVISINGPNSSEAKWPVEPV